MNRIVICLCMSLLSAFAALSLAQDRKPERDSDAEKAVAKGMEAARKEEWKSYAELVHPQSLDDYKKMWLPALTAAAKAGSEQKAELLTMFDKTDLQSITAMEPTEFFISSMKGMASQFRKEKVPSPFDAEVTIIGTVHERDDQAHAVVRTKRKFEGSELTQMEVITLKRSGGEWKIMLPDTVRILADSLQRSGTNVEKSGPVQDTPKPKKK